MRSTLTKSPKPSFARLANFLLRERDEVIRSWLDAVKKHPKISASNKLTFVQLQDHLPELCKELGLLLKSGGQEAKQQAKRDAKAHGWKRWRQGYKLDELIRELCVIRRESIDNWLDGFARSDPTFDLESQNAARRVIARFFDNVVIEATVHFVSERQQTVRQVRDALKQEKKRAAAMKAELFRKIAHRLREPLAPLLFVVEILRQEKWLSQEGADTLKSLEQSVQQESKLIEDMLEVADHL